VSHVFVVDDHTIVLEAIRLVCEQDTELHFAGGAPSVPEATRALAEVRADVLLIDMELPSALDLVRTARERWPQAGILAVHDGSPPDLLREALELGAAGVVPKSAETAELVGAIRRAASGRPRSHGSLGVTRPEGRQEVDHGNVDLSLREHNVLRLLVRGRSNREIGAELGISPRTVASHVASVYRKLQVDTRVDAATAAIRLGIASDLAPGDETDRRRSTGDT
jgi:two-component system, NarL family, response regulator DevR